MCSYHAEMNQKIIIEALQHTYCLSAPARIWPPPPAVPPPPSPRPAPASPCVVKRRVNEMQISTRRQTIHVCTFCIGARNAVLYKG